MMIKITLHKLNILYLIYSVTFVASSLAMEEESDVFTSRPGHSSTATMPREYQCDYELLKPLPSLNLDIISPHEDVPSDRLDSWKPKEVASQGFMIVMGLNFLNFDSDGFKRLVPGHIGIEAVMTETQKPFYFAGLWNSLWLSASLVSKTKYPTAGSYGIVLEIPPQLILKTYQLDSTTMTHSALVEKGLSGADINQVAKNHLDHDGVYNSEMIFESNVMGSRRIFADGETIDSHPFMTPKEMIGRGRQFEHNEIKFIPKARYQGKCYETKISGIWYKDKLWGNMMQSPVLDYATIIQLREISNDLGIELIPLSQGYSTQ